MTNEYFEIFLRLLLALQLCDWRLFWSKKLVFTVCTGSFSCKILYKKNIGNIKKILSSNCIFGRWITLSHNRNTRTYIVNHCSLKSNPVNIQSPETRPEYILLTWTFQKSRGPNHEVQQNAQVNSFRRTYMVFVSGLWIVAKLDFRDKWSVCNLDSVSNCLQHTQRSKKRKNSTKLSLWVLIIYFFDYRSSASSTTSPSCFSLFFEGFQVTMQQ